MLTPEQAENAPNMPEMEMQWAVLAFEHAETYFKLISSHPDDTSSLRLTPMDDDIYKHFRAEFPLLDISNINEEQDLKSAQKKEQWRNFIMVYEKSVEDYNFGSLLRIDPAKDYEQDNSVFVTRLQFLAIEIARNREGKQFKNPAKKSQAIQC